MIDKSHLEEWAGHLLRQLHIIVTDMGIYPPGHPMIEGSLKNFCQSLKNVLLKRDNLTFSVVKGRLLVEDRSLDEKDKTFNRFATYFVERNIQGVTFLRGIKEKEIKAFLQIIILKPESLIKTGGPGKLLSQEGISHIRINEVYYKKISKGEAVVKEEEELRDIIITNYLSGKLRDIGEKKENFIKEIEKNPKRIALLMTQVADAVGFSKEKKDLRPITVLEGMQRIGDHILQGSKEGWRASRKNLAQVVLALDPELRALVLSSQAALSVNGKKDLLRDIINQFSDKTISELIMNEYHRGGTTPRLKALTSRLLEEHERRKRLLPVLEEKLNQAGMSREDSSLVLGLPLWSELPVEERASRLLEKNPEELLDRALVETINSVIPELREKGEDKVIEEIIKKVLENLDCPSAILRKQGALKFQKILDLCLREKGYYPLIRSSLDRLIQNLSKEEDIGVYSTLAEDLERIAGHSISMGEYDLTNRILRVFKEHATLGSKRSPEERKRAVEAEGVIGNPRAINDLIANLCKREEEKFPEIIQSLTLMGEETARPLLAILWDEKDIDIRKRIVSVLKVTGRGVLEDLKKGLSDGRWYVLKDIVEILGGIGEESATASLIIPLNHDYFKVRMETVLALKKIGGARAIELLVAALDDRNDLVRETAATSLENMGAVSALPALFKIIHRRRFLKKDITFQKKTIEALAKIDPKGAKPEIIRLLEKRPQLGRKRYDEIRICAAIILGRMGAQEALPELEKAAKDKDERLRQAAEEAIKEIKKPLNR